MMTIIKRAWTAVTRKRRRSLTIALIMTLIFTLLIGTLMVTGEFRHKTLTPTFLATPRRGLALAGKVVAGIVMGALYAALAIVAAVILLLVFGFFPRPMLHVIEPVAHQTMSIVGVTDPAPAAEEGVK